MHSTHRVLFFFVLLLCTLQTLQETVARKEAENPETERPENGRKPVGSRKLLSARNVIESKVQTSKEGDTKFESFWNAKTLTPSDARGTATSVEGNDKLVYKDAEISSSVASPSGPGASSTDEASYQNPSLTKSRSKNRSGSRSSSSKKSKSSTSKSRGGTPRSWSPSPVSPSSGGSAFSPSKSTTSTTASSTSCMTTGTPVKSPSPRKEPVKSPAKTPRGSTLSKRRSADDDDDDDDDDGGMSRGAKAGSAVSGIFGLILFASGIALCARCRSNRRKKKAEYTELPSEQVAEVDPHGNTPLQVPERD